MIIPFQPPAILADATSISGAQVIVAKASGDAVLIWDASSTITEILRRKVPPALAMRSIEAQAADLLALRGPALKSAKSISLRVVYPRKPEFNPQYGNEVAATVERLMTLKASPATLVHDGKTWSAMIQKGGSPRGLDIMVTGTLPPE